MTSAAGTPAPPGVFGAAGASFLAIAETVGGMGLLAGQVAKRVFTLRFDGGELMRNLYRMGVKSIPIVVVTALFTGVIMVIQAAPLVQRLRRRTACSAGARASARCARSRRSSRR